MTMAIILAVLTVLLVLLGGFGYYQFTLIQDLQRQIRSIRKSIKAMTNGIDDMIADVDQLRYNQATTQRAVQGVIRDYHTAPRDKSSSGRSPSKRIAEAAIAELTSFEKNLTQADQMTDAMAEDKKTAQADLAKAVREAIIDGRIAVSRQPVVGLPKRRRRFYEMFSQIILPDGSHLKPDAFIQMAKDQRLIPMIDNLLLLQCVSILEKTVENEQAAGYFCNITAQSLRDKDFMQDLLAMLQKNMSLAPRLIFEMSQADYVALDDKSVQLLETLGKLGCRFSMDHVKGIDLSPTLISSSNLSFIKVNIDVIIHRLRTANGPDDFEKFRASLADNNIKLIVEKVETEAQLFEMMDHYLDLAQGYLFGMPETIDTDNVIDVVDSAVLPNDMMA